MPYTLNVGCGACGEQIVGRRFRWYGPLVFAFALFSWRHRHCAQGGKP